MREAIPSRGTDRVGLPWSCTSPEPRLFDAKTKAYTTASRLWGRMDRLCTFIRWSRASVSSRTRDVLWTEHEWRRSGVVACGTCLRRSHALARPLSIRRPCLVHCIFVYSAIPPPLRLLWLQSRPNQENTVPLPHPLSYLLSREKKRSIPSVPSPSGRVEHLLHRLPPRRGRWLGCALGGARYQRLLEAVRHGPPLAHFGVLPHALHVAGVVVPDVSEGGEQEARVGVVEYAVWRGPSAAEVG